MSRVLIWLQSLSPEVDLTEFRLECGWMLMVDRNDLATAFVRWAEIDPGFGYRFYDFFKNRFCTETGWGCRPLAWRDPQRWLEGF